jgi:hypothetical protein
VVKSPPCNLLSVSDVQRSHPDDEGRGPQHLEVPHLRRLYLHRVSHPRPWTLLCNVESSWFFLCEILTSQNAKLVPFSKFFCLAFNFSLILNISTYDLRPVGMSPASQEMHQALQNCEISLFHFAPWVIPVNPDLVFHMQICIHISSEDQSVSESCS